GQFYFESVDATAAPGRFVDEHPGFPEAVETAARRAGSGVIGVDSYLPDEVLRRIAALPGVKDVVDATEWMYQVRAVKLPAEMDRLAVAARLAEDGIGIALDTAAPGITEREMSAAVAGAMVAGGAVPRFVVVTVGERSALSDARPTDRKWEPGELLRFDVGCVYQGYWSDVGRTAVRGEPNRLQAHRYRAILAGEEAQLHQVRPGLGADDLFRVAVEAVEAAGLRPYRRHHCGHAIGTEVYEQPIIAPGWETDLKENMVLCLETPFYELGWGGMMVEDTVVVTAEGHRRLTTSDRSLCVIEP
ncbi:MAG: M24 family metallopeptidase, partial [Acidimicrobiia bacterium]